MIVWAVVFFMHFIVYISITDAFAVTVPYAYPILGVLSFSYLFASMLVRKVGGVVADIVYYFAAIWLGTIFILFSWQLLYLLIHLVTGLSSIWLSGALLVLGTKLATYAIWNGRRLTVKEYTLPLKHLTTPVRVVHLRGNGDRDNILRISVF
jgi:hypothetical protein